ncbi:hypothetical protein HMPREF1548_03897 [Clostridium sp. KLE 1755]|nr:hypothetical protein HMPREF1548_03897 [Clostridium sp. KLE 1755]
MGLRNFTGNRKYKEACTAVFLPAMQAFRFSFFLLNYRINPAS